MPALIKMRDRRLCKHIILAEASQKVDAILEVINARPDKVD
jgi:hypothetical protein